MKFLILLYLSLLSCTSFSQLKGTDIHIEYKMFCDTDLPITFNTSLWISKNVSIYKERYSTTEKWQEKPTEIVGVDYSRLRNNNEPYLKIDNNKKEILFFNSISSHIFLIKDNYNDLKWNITNETQTIAGYECIKATTNYRGREWIAWFTPQIPLPFGPWKLHGLPGLILETYDITKRFTLKAVKIENMKSDIFNIDFNTLQAAENKKPITYQQFLERKEEADSNGDKMLSNDKNLEIKIQKEPRSGEELIYEWE